jgi:poly-beta-1,6-N-acetyl-D-glucosamine synthase
MLWELYQENPILFLALSVLALLTLVQLIYYWFVYSRLAFYKPEEDYTRKDEPVSVIVSARNESQNLAKNLPLLLEQDYSDFEVVVVNHASEDDTYYLLRDLQVKYENLKVVTIYKDFNFFVGKKFPLSIGIKSARNELLILTDADCRPASNLWIRRIVANYTPGTEIVLGYGPYEKKNGLMNRLIRFDTVRVALNYFSFTLAGMPYMGVGRNLSYRKSLFYSQGGLVSHYRINTGDDDLFINKAATKRNTRIELRPESFSVSEPKTSWDEWSIQKKRHLSGGKYYKPVHKFVLGLYEVSLFLFYAGIITLLVFWYHPYIVLGFFGLRLISQLFIYKRSMNKLSEKGFLFLIPIFELILLIAQPYMTLTNTISKPVQWR